MCFYACSEPVEQSAELISDEQVSSMHTLRTRWMVELLLLMVPDQCDAQEPHLPPSPELNAFKDVSFQKLEEDAKNLAQKLNYFSKYISR